MDPLGDYLKQAREKKGLSLEQVASQTRIQEHHLQALESEDFANLPAKVFAKGFVRSYAKALGLDEEEALRRFLQASGTFYDQHQPEQPQPHAQVTLEAPPRQGMNWNLVFGVMVVIAAIAVWYGLPKKQDTPIALSEPETSAPIEPIEEPILPIADPQESVVPIKPVESLPTLPSPQVPAPVPTQPLPRPVAPTSAEPIPPAPPAKPKENATADGAHTLEIEATQLTWVVVKSDKQAPNEALLQPGQRIIWKADTQFLVTLGNAAGVVIRLNGQPQGPFGKPGQVVRDIRLRP
jgi:cytoskeletal protein RodZ